MAVVVATAGGCASYTHKTMGVRASLERGDFVEAQTYFEDRGSGRDRLPDLMELGLVLRLQDQLPASNDTFDRAEILIEDLYTKSISKEALSLALNDEVRAYSGEPWERVLVNYYRAMNYVDLGRYDGALVECRKINHKLKVYADSDDSPPTYQTDAFAEYLTALLYEAGGETNDAWVSLRLADEAYAHYEEAYGVPAPSFLAQDLLRLAEQQGYTDDLDRLRAQFPDVQWTPTTELLERGEIVVFYEEGFVPAKVQQDITIPILKTEHTLETNELARKLSQRAHTHHEYSRTELDYVLRVAIPTYLPPDPQETPGHAVVRTGDVECRSEIAEDVGAIARRGLDDAMGRILFRTILRGLAKYAITKAAENESETAGILTNLFAAITEKADTRSWITLPNTIQIARIVVEPGTHDIAIDCYDASGQQLDTVTFENVEIGAGQVRFLAHRAFAGAL